MTKPKPLKDKSEYYPDSVYNDYTKEDIKSACEWLIIEDVKIKKKIAKVLSDENICPRVCLKIGTYLQMMTTNKEKAFEDVYKEE